MANWTYVAGSFGLTWLVLVVYLLRLRRRMSRARSAWDAATWGEPSPEPRADRSARTASPEPLTWLKS